MKAKDIKIAELKFFDKDHFGIEVSEVQSYGLIAKVGGITDSVYLNLLNPFEEYPIFERLPYSNCNSDGVEYGAKVISVGKEELETGPCWVIGKENLFEVLGKEDVEKEDIEDFVLKSPFYYKDRMPLVKRKMKKSLPFSKRFSDLYCTFYDDTVDKRKMDEFFECRCKQKVNVKKDW